MNTLFGLGDSLEQLDDDYELLLWLRPGCSRSKVLEVLMKERRRPQLYHETYSSTRQYGYRSQRGTEDAVSELRRAVQDSASPMVLALFFDITGAFDNLK
uniref:Reverse transcriptase domain-containing protein n=1 Tax=Trichogramma kaykai TaxID=54128 RepID=A0ABD2W676_9HYME